MRAAVLTLLLLVAPPRVAAAQMPSSAASSAIDPARLAAAHRVVDLLFPADSRDQLIDGMIAPLLKSEREGLLHDPGFVQHFGSDPRFLQLFDDFMKQEGERGIAQMRTAWPGMVEVMERAYARRFDPDQLSQIEAFFETPTGHAYREASLTLMSDPDVAAWQKTIMAQSVSRMQQDMADFADKAAALKGGCAQPKPCARTH